MATKMPKKISTGYYSPNLNSVSEEPWYNAFIEVPLFLEAAKNGHFGTTNLADTIHLFRNVYIYPISRKDDVLSWTSSVHPRIDSININWNKTTTYSFQFWGIYGSDNLWYDPEVVLAKILGNQEFCVTEGDLTEDNRKIARSSFKKPNIIKLDKPLVPKIKFSESRTKIKEQETVKSDLQLALDEIELLKTRVNSLGESVILLMRQYADLQNAQKLPSSQRRAKRTRPKAPPGTTSDFYNPTSADYYDAEKKDKATKANLDKAFKAVNDRTFNPPYIGWTNGKLDPRSTCGTNLKLQAPLPKRKLDPANFINPKYADKPIREKIDFFKQKVTTLNSELSKIRISKTDSEEVMKEKEKSRKNIKNGRLRVYKTLESLGVNQYTNASRVNRENQRRKERVTVIFNPPPNFPNYSPYYHPQPYMCPPPLLPGSWTPVQRKKKLRSNAVPIVDPNKLLKT